MKLIPRDEVEFHPHSFGDPQVRLFHWRGEIYRGVSSQYAPFYRRLFEGKIIDHAVNKGLLIDSELTQFVVDGYELVVHHRQVVFPSYPNEWCAAMLREAALTTVDLAWELGRDGLTLGDAHPWNLLFDVERRKPVFVDLGSIVPIVDFTWSAYEEFCRFSLYPLLLMSHGEDQLARLLMCEDKGVLGSDILKLRGLSLRFLLSRYRSSLQRAESVFARRVPDSYRHWLRQKLTSVQTSAFKDSAASGLPGNPSKDLRHRFHRRFLEKIRREVERVSVPLPEMTRPEGGSFPISAQADWTGKQRCVHRLLTELRPATLIDISCGAGWYAKLAASLGSRVVCWDANPMRVTRLYRDACHMKLPILPLIMDFTKPTTARGLANHWSIAAIDRFRCDMVLALGVLHHIVCERRLNFEQITDGLASLAKRWVLVEFISSEDVEMKPIWSSRISWYSRDNFLNSLQKRFCNIQLLDSDQDTRTLLFCEKQL